MPFVTNGYAVFSIAENLPGIPDTHVLSHATNSSAMLITADKDFGEPVFRQGLVKKGIVAAALQTHAEKLAGTFRTGKHRNFLGVAGTSVRQGILLPDVAIVCGAPRFTDDQKDTLLNPVVLVEVLSSSTEAYDQGSKFEQYRQIESLRADLLISQNNPRVEIFERGAGPEWIFRDYAGLNTVSHLASMDCDVLLRTVYDDVT